MIKKIMWYSIIVVASIGFVALSIGFYQAMLLTSDSSKSVSEEVSLNKIESLGASKNSNAIYITIMGDSIARGAGDENGKGFSEDLPEILKNSTSKDFSIENVAIDGLRSANLLAQIQSTKLDNLFKNSDIILISIGGNDIRTIQNLDGASKDQSFNELQDRYLSDLKQLMKTIRKNNKDTLVVFLGLYNPYQLKSSFDDNRMINIWNSNTQQFIEADNRSVFIPTYDLFKFNVKKYIAPDGLHPNATGYQAISNRITEAIEALLDSK